MVLNGLDFYTHFKQKIPNKCLGSKFSFFGVASPYVWNTWGRPGRDTGWLKYLLPKQIQTTKNSWGKSSDNENNGIRPPCNKQPASFPEHRPGNLSQIRLALLLCSFQGGSLWRFGRNNSKQTNLSFKKKDNSAFSWMFVFFCYGNNLPPIWFGDLGWRKEPEISSFWSCPWKSWGCWVSIVSKICPPGKYHVLNIPPKKKHV